MSCAARAVDDVVQDPVARRQELARARAPALDEELLVEAALHQRVDEAAQRLLVDRVVLERAAQEVRARAGQDPAHREERHVDAGRGVRRREARREQERVERHVVAVRLVRRDEHERRAAAELAQLVELARVDVDRRIERERVHPAREAPEDLHREQVVTRRELAQRASRRARVTPRGSVPAWRPQSATRSWKLGVAEDLLGEQARHLVAVAEHLALRERERLHALHAHERRQRELVALRVRLAPRARCACPARRSPRARSRAAGAAASASSPAGRRDCRTADSTAMAVARPDPRAPRREPGRPRRRPPARRPAGAPAGPVPERGGESGTSTGSPARNAARRRSSATFPCVHGTQRGTGRPARARLASSTRRSNAESTGAR